jgi:hypothetical protein
MNRTPLLLACLLLVPELYAQDASGTLEAFRLPVADLAFAENRGQWPEEVRFLARLPGVNVWVTSAGIVYDFYERAPPAGPMGTAGADAGGRGGELRGRAIVARFVGGEASRVEGRSPKQHYHNYFSGDDASGWAAGTPLYGEVVLEDVYENVSLRLWARDGELAHDLVLGAQALQSDVRIELEGADGLDLTATPRLDRAAVLGITEPSTTTLARSGPASETGFRSAQDAGRRRLSRFLGGSLRETARGVVVGDDGSVYLVGQTRSGDFPTPNGYDTALHGTSDGYLARLLASGEQVYGTYLGGSGTEEVFDVVYANGSVYLTGVTSSPNYPTTPGAYSTQGTGQAREDAFVTRLRTDGAGPVFSTYLGGSGNDFGGAIALRDDGAVVVGGRTYSQNFPAPNGSHSGAGDAFVIVFSGDGTTLLNGTLLGGSGLDEVRALETGNGSIYVAGDTNSSDFTGLSGRFGGGTDAFVARLNASGSGVISGTYLGGSGFDGAVGPGADGRSASIDMALDQDGNLYVIGDTGSEDFPTTARIGPLGSRNAFVTRLGPDAASIAWSTVFGGSGVDRARGIGVAADGTIHLTGETSSADFPVVNADDAIYNGLGDAFVLQLTSDGAELLYGTFLGGSDRDAAFDLVIGENGLTYVVGETRSAADFPVSISPPLHGGEEDAFVAAFDLRLNLSPVVVNPIPDLSLGVGSDPFVIDLETVFEDPEGDPLTFTCASSAPAAASASECSGGTLTVTPLAAGETTVTVTASDGINPAVSTDFVVTVTQNLPPVVVNPVPDLTMGVDEDPFEIDLNDVFEDPEGDPLTFTCLASNPAVASVGDCTDGELEVTPLAAGQMTVTVTASDGVNPAVSTAFAVLVSQNLPPVVVNPIPDLALAIDDDPVAIDLTTVFEDPEGDPLTFTCASSAPSAASVASCADGILTVTPLAAGETTVTVTASDGINPAVSTAFQVTVLENLPPVVVNPVPDLSLGIGSDPFVIDLETVFEDPEGDPLTFTCSSSAPGVASVASCANGVLRVTPLTPGQSTITATASDANNPAVVTSFAVTVTEALPPVVVNPLQDLALRMDDNPFLIDLAAVFEDPAGKSLTFTCASGDPSVASASDCTGGLLTVTPLAAGAATVTVTATNEGGAIAQDEFVVSVTCEPVSTRDVTPSTTQPQEGSDVTVSAMVEGSQEVLLRYRRGGATAFAAAPMVRSSDGFVGTIPGSFVSSLGAEYLVEAVDACGAVVQSPVYALRVNVPAGVTSPALPRSSEQAGYRLVSVPLALEEDGAAAVFSEFGSYGDGAWRLFELLAPGVVGDAQAGGTDDQWYREDPAAISLEPGRAFWLIVREGGTFNTGAGVTLSSGEIFSLDLHRGWNLVGSPFGHDLPLSRVRLESGAPVQLHAFEGTWRTETLRMNPFRGYALRSDGQDRLIVDPPAGTASARAQNTLGREDGTDGWAIDITAQVGDARSENTVALVSPDAEEGRDPLDWFEPPAIGDHVSVAFDPPAGVSAPLTVDARPVPSDGVSWPLQVRSNLRGRVDLSFGGIDSVPADFEVWLVDDEAGTVQDLRRNPDYRIASRADRAGTRLRLVVGTEAYAQAETGFDSASPADFQLAPSYPNPFSSMSTVTYALPRAEHVVLEVFDLMGRRVATLVDEEVDAGFHSVVWDGRGNGGQTDLASGVYVYRLRAGSFVASQRAVLVR